MSTSVERIKELTDKLETGVRQVFDSEQYKAYLKVMSKFHRYSFGNVMLIMMQRPDASLVAGFDKWKRLGRSVKKNEKGIMILAPCQYKKLVDKEVENEDGTKQKQTVFEQRQGFKVAYVFDVSQTEGRELPNISVSELSGEVADFTAIYDRLAALSPLPVEQGHVPGTAKGYASFLEQRIVVRPGMSEVQTIKTLVHEIAHAKLHNPDLLAPEERKLRREKEVEAESVAYVVCQHFGIETSDYSFGYVAGWSKGKELAELKSSLDRIHSTAGEIINAIQPPPPVQEREAPEQSRRPSPKRKTKRK